MGQSLTASRSIRYISVVGGFAIGLMAGLGGCTDSSTGVAGMRDEQTASVVAAEQALARAKVTDNLALKFDYLAAAARQAPQHPAVLSALIEAAEANAGGSPDWAFDVAELANALVSSQSIGQIESARRRLDSLRESLALAMSLDYSEDSMYTDDVGVAESPISRMTRRLQMIEEADHWSPDIRIEALVQIENELVARARDSLTGFDGGFSVEEYDQMRGLVDQTHSLLQRQIVDDTWVEVTEWRRDVDQLEKKLIEHIEHITRHDEIPPFSQLQIPGQDQPVDRKFDRALAIGFGYIQRISPAAEADIPNSWMLLERIKETNNRIERIRREAYNRWALQIIRKRENDKPALQEVAGFTAGGMFAGRDSKVEAQAKTRERLESLLQIDESVLDPAFGAKFDKVWKKHYEELNDEDLKIEFIFRRMR